MTMPILPGLMNEGGAAAEAPSITELLDSLELEQVQELVTLLTAEDVGGEEDETEGADEGEEPPGDGEEPEGEPPSEEVETEEETEQDAEARSYADSLAESGDLAELSKWAEDSLAEAEACVDELEVLLDTATKAEEQGADPEAVEEVLERVQSLFERAEEAAEEVITEVKAENAKGAAEAALRVEKLMRRIHAAKEDAIAAADVTSTTPSPMDEPALKVWAERTRPKGNPY